MILSNSSKFTLYILFEPTRAHVYSKSFCNNKLFFRISSLEKPWCPWMFLPPRKSSPLYSLPANLLTPQGFPPALVFVDPTKQWWVDEIIPKSLLSNDEKKHVDTYMVMNTSRNKKRTKYFKEVL